MIFVFCDLTRFFPLLHCMIRTLCAALLFIVELLLDKCFLSQARMLRSLRKWCLCLSQDGRSSDGDRGAQRLFKFKFSSKTKFWKFIKLSESAKLFDFTALVDVPLFLVKFLTKKTPEHSEFVWFWRKYNVNPGDNFRFLKKKWDETLSQHLNF